VPRTQQLNRVIRATGAIRIVTDAATCTLNTKTHVIYINVRGASIIRL
jgi:hypothetical protein